MIKIYVLSSRNCSLWLMSASCLKMLLKCFETILTISALLGISASSPKSAPFSELPSKFHPERSWCPKSCSSWKLWSNFPYENISQSIFGILPSECANAESNQTTFGNLPSFFTLLVTPVFKLSIMSNLVVCSPNLELFSTTEELES